MSAITKSIRGVFSRQQQDIKKEMNEIQKLGTKFTLDMSNSAKTELELDVLDVLDDPLNDADFKIRRIYRLIVLNYKYASIYDNPRIAPLISVSNRIMSKWNILINEKRRTFGNFAIVDMEVPYLLPNGMVQIRVERQRLSPPVFTHQYFQYMSGSDWHLEQMRRLYGKEEQKWKWLKFTPVSASIETAKDYREPTQEEQEVMERTERFANTEIVYRMFTIYSWMHREKFTFPNTPIVIQGMPQPQQQFGQGQVRSTSTFGGDMPKPDDEPVDRVSTA